MRLNPIGLVDKYGKNVPVLALIVGLCSLFLFIGVFLSISSVYSD